MTEYKVGDWLRHKATGYLVEIITIAEWPEQNVTKYYAQWRTGHLKGDDTISSTKYNFDEFFVKAPAAQVLLGNKE